MIVHITQRATPTATINMYYYILWFFNRRIRLRIRIIENFELFTRVIKVYFKPFINLMLQKKYQILNLSIFLLEI